MNDVESSKKVTVYRLFDSDGRLLYIGCANDFESRLQQHKKDKAWYGDIDSERLEYFSTREEALAAEHDAIIAERPLYNIVYNYEETDGRILEKRGSLHDKAVVTLSPPVTAKVRAMALDMAPEGCEPVGPVGPVEVVRRALMLLDLKLSLSADEELVVRNRKTGECERFRFVWEMSK